MPQTTSRGARRRDALVSAAADLLLESGPTALTARAVAARAGAPLAATTYYFADQGQLARSAAERVAQDHLQVAAEAVRAVDADASAAGVAEQVLAIALGPHTRERASVLAMYDRTLAVAAHASLAAAFADLDERLCAAVGEMLERCCRTTEHARALLACADGLLVSQLLRNHEDVWGGALAELTGVVPILAGRTCVA